MAKKVKARRWRPDKPLGLEGTAPAPRERSNPRAFLAGPLARGVRLLPTWRQTAAGERKRVATKLALGALAVWFATLSKDHLAWVAPSLAAVLLAVLLPVRRRTRDTWLREAHALAGPRVVLVDAPARVSFDGRKLAMESDGRQWSVRPGYAPVHTGSDERGPWLALATAKDPAAGAAFRPEPGTDELGSSVPEGPCPCPPERVVTLDAEGWELILATFAPELSRMRGRRR